MSNMNEADLLDVVRRLRQNVAILDSCDWLVDKVKLLDNQLLNNLADEVYARVNHSATSIATLLKHIENNQQYRDIIKKYRSQTYVEKDDGEE
jgi:hypothetical protein